MQVATHNNDSDCWLIIENKIYDVTNYLYSHPDGEDIIIKYCGQDATVAFETKDKTSKPKNHSSKARAMLADYYIGESR